MFSNCKSVLEQKNGSKVTFYHDIKCSSVIRNENNKIFELVLKKQDNRRHYVCHTKVNSFHRPNKLKTCNISRMSSPR